MSLTKEGWERGGLKLAVLLLMTVLLPANGEILLMNYRLRFAKTLENESKVCSLTKEGWERGGLKLAVLLLMTVLLPANGEILLMNYRLRFAKTLENESKVCSFLAFQRPLNASGTVQLFVHNLNIVMHTVYTKIAVKIGLLLQNCTCVP